MNIQKVIIPVAGWGTRSLPASKTIPKEMLPIYTKPVIQYIVEEAIQAGVHDVVFVSSRGKSSIEDHFDYNLPLENALEKGGKEGMLPCIRQVAEMVNVFSVRQKKQLGLGHAVSCAKDLVANEAFAVMVGDDVLFADPSGLRQLVEVSKKYNVPTIGVMEVEENLVNRYGIVMGDEIEDGLYRITDMVEKPPVGTVSSRLAIVGRYVLTPDLFPLIESVGMGELGEIQLTDALKQLAKQREVLAVRLKGKRFDAGDWVDYVAANVYAAISDPNLHDKVFERVSAVLEESKSK